jgi:hypothetical protein
LVKCFLLSINMNQNQNTTFLHENTTITLYAQDGSTRQVQTNENGELSLEDTQWLNSHGGGLPLDQVPQQDKACIRQSAASVEARRTNNVFNGGGRSFEFNSNTNIIEQKKQITLYAQDGSTRQAQTNENGELSLQDTQWLNSHGGALPLDQVPQQDKACIRQSGASVEARRTNNVFNGGGSFEFNSNINNQQRSNIIEQKKQITLYAQDGSTKQVETNEHGELELSDLQWLNSHGGALPLNQVPQQDKACIRQSASSVEARRTNNNNF